MRGTVPAAKARRRSLSSAHLSEIHRASLAIDEAFNCRVDIEWVVDDDGLTIVQARPITALPEFFPHTLTESEARGVTLKNDVLPATWATLDAYRLVFEKNGTNLDDVLDAHRDLTRAEVDLTDALVDYRRRLVVLEGLVGHDLAVGN